MNAKSILLVDDDDIFRTKVQESLQRTYFITNANSEAEFRRLFRPHIFDLIILDMRLESGREGLRLLREILALDELQPVIMVSAYGDTDAVLDSAESGALMFLHKQEFTPELLARMAEAVLQQARVRRHLAAVRGRIPPAEVIALTGTNPAIQKTAKQVQRAADEADCTVMIVGEPGTGHELTAQIIHDQSRKRSESPLVTASGLTLQTDESRTALFGSPRRGGIPRQKGLLEQSNGGVLFIDRMEILDSGVRQSLMETLRKRTLELDPVEPPIPLNLQLVAGVAPDGFGIVMDELHDLAAGDMLVEIYLPPLRDRREDIPVLAAYFLQELRREGRTTARILSRDALALLEEHDWPGNLPELRNAVEFGAIKALADESEEIDQGHLPANLIPFAGINGSAAAKWDYRYHTARAEVALTQRAIQEKGALNKTQLAEALGYTDRYAFSRRIVKALKQFPDIAQEFPQVSGMFRVLD